MERIYLDHAATTPLDAAVLDVMRPYLTEHFGNPSSVHAMGRQARVALEESRARIAEALGAEPAEIVFTSGGTEADNAALALARGGHLVTSAAEHEAVLQPAEALREEGRTAVTILDPQPHGAVTPAQVAAALAEKKSGKKTLVSFMHANNEVGTLTPVREIAALCREKGALFHTDAVQTAGLFALDVKRLGADLVSLSAHKFYGPKGIGALYVRGGVDFLPFVRGGSQERARRGGTENVAAAVGMAEALARAVEEAEARTAHLEKLQQRLVQKLREKIGEGSFVLNTPLGEAPVAPHIVSVSFPPDEGGQPLDGEMLLLNLDVEGVMASAGSACTSGALEPSHVILALGRERATAAATVRFSLGKDTTAKDVDRAADALAATLGRMRGRG